ncbi:MAG: hypothetical protein EPO18_04810 [Methylobacter sp.]|nr:MAG: hypothetical protein EPO18_04810 [Methylobacter sp.]
MIIEMQSSRYVGENDIIRFEDDYSRDNVIFVGCNKN